MLNKVWFALLAIGLLYGFGKALVGTPAVTTAAPTSAPTANDPAPAAASPSRLDTVSDMGRRLTSAAIESAQTSVEICIALIGMMALWLGIMKIAEDAGLVTMLARALRPVMRWLFPEVPSEHPANGAMLMNIAANMIGLDNAATPLGLKAMKELQTLNPRKDTATNSMTMFLALNTSGIALVSFTVIAYRKAAGSINPASVVVATLLATTCSTIVAIIAARTLQRYFPAGPAMPTSENAAQDELTGAADGNAGAQEGRR